MQTRAGEIEQNETARTSQKKAGEDQHDFAGAGTRSSLSKETGIILRHSTVYGFGNMLNRIISFLMLPVYTRFLSPADYGILALIEITLALVGTVVEAGISSGLYRFYYEQDDNREKNALVSTAFLTYGCLGFLVLGAISLIPGLLAHYILGSQDYALFFRVAIISLWFGILCQIGFDYLRVRERSGIFLAFSAGRLTASLSLNILFVVVLKKGILGILLSTLITNIATTLLLVVPVLVMTGLHFSKAHCRELLRYGLPLIPTGLAAQIAYTSDRYFLKSFISLEATGLYSLGRKLGSTVNDFITSPFNQIWATRRFQTYKQEGAEKVFARVFTYFVACIVFAGLALSVLGHDILRLMTTPQFYGAASVLPVIVLSYIVLSFHQHFNIGILISKKTKYLACINGATTVLAIFVNSLLIPRFGMIGAAYAALVCFAFKSGAMYAISVRFYPIRFEFARVGKLLVVAGLIYFLSTLFSLSSLFADIAIKGVLIAAFPLALLLTGFLTDQEQEAVLRAAGFVAQGYARLRALLVSGEVD